ncbi:hypothetical protein OG884_20560 [Streptosporangium sp. NBC_01755]|uniref:DUF7065 domain-containing protein n=1 Tax=Streptosporangium sp. NBC_01755 TaxID=2975949 RepID=UPI002DDA655F|nr:hypothetical protein [Streptosporangium sp. NBC_01755]WSC97289.1 hypothetical protein OG884_20560 [Streptosporangium sp. NBC_01755]
MTAVDDGPHIPPAGKGPAWQESWSLDWYDPESGAAGAYRLRTDWARRTAEVRTWTAIGAEVAKDVQTIVRPGDTPGGGHVGTLRFGDLLVRTVMPLRSYVVAAGRPGSEVQYTAFTEPFRFSMSGQRADPGGEYYESFGRVTGTVQAGGRALELSTYAFYRHIWGVPATDTHPVQSVRGVFGEDLFFSIVEYRTPTGRAPLGYLFEGGEFHGVEKVRFRTETDDGGTPRGCDLLIATADRRDFRIPGVVAVSTGDGPGFATFDLGRRRGGGILEVHDHRG